MAAKGRSKSLFQWRKELERKPPSRIPKPIVLVVCEGAKTEPTYFQALRRAKRMSPQQIKIVPGEEGSHPKNVVEYAKSLKEGIRQDGLIVDEVWFVFDRDDHAEIEAAFIQARGNHFQIAFSNPCFELWYLLHYQDQTAHIERNWVFSRLKKYLPQYEKASSVYPDLSSHQSQAISRAKKLRKLHRDNGNSEKQNPSTNVDELVSYLNSLNSL
jgi:hypothetical protein